MIEHYFPCPYCMAEISMLLDVSVRSQAYIEDCEVCCQPIAVAYSQEGGELEDFQVESIEQ
jgi:transcription elongation factor Elf1